MAGGKRGRGLSFAGFDKFASSKLKMYITSPDSGTLEEKALSRQEFVLTNNRQNKAWGQKVLSGGKLQKTKEAKDINENTKTED